MYTLMLIVNYSGSNIVPYLIGMHLRSSVQMALNSLLAMVSGSKVRR